MGKELRHLALFFLLALMMASVGIYIGEGRQEKRPSPLPVEDRPEERIIVPREKTLEDRVVEALQEMPADGLRVFHGDNYAEERQSGQTLSEREIQVRLGDTPLEDASRSCSWSHSEHGLVTLSSMGTDRLHHIVNGYLVGYAPFKVEEPWQPLYVLAGRLRYQLDNAQYEGLEEVWQTSREAFFNTRGDCEDHALALADWLIDSGYEARVVLGEAEGEGHAWVVVFDGGKTYLLEATDKRRRKHWQHIPLAAFAGTYLPHFMFDRDNLWEVKPGKRGYGEASWRLVSRYYPAGEVQ